LGAELVSDVGVDAVDVLSAVDVVDVAAGLAGEAAELVADVDLGGLDAGADAVDRDGAAGVRGPDRTTTSMRLLAGDHDERPGARSLSRHPRDRPCCRQGIVNTRRRAGANGR